MYDMRAPDGRPGGYNRPGRTFEDELNLRYLSPGAFTVLSPEENGSPPDPPPAPQQFRLSPNANVRRNKNQSFSIIAEPANYEPSRSPSPTSGRVSPFRGRGFNPTGSRHASPAGSPPPPPEDNRLSYQQNNNNASSRKRSNIPQLKRHNSSTMLSTEESSDSSPKHQRRNSLLKPQLSRSLNNIGPRVSNKPPTAPGNRRPGGIYSRNSSFSRLSPIIGSSPEPSTDSKSQSSPSRIPMSRSSPSSRKHSPDNDKSSHHGSATNLNNKHLSASNAGLSRSRSRVGSQATSRNASRNASRNQSREASPSGKPPISPTKIPTKNYRNVQAKVNSFNAKSKTKVPNTNASSHSSTSNNHSTNRLKPSDKNRSKSSSNSKLNRTESITSVSKSSSFAKKSANNNNTNKNNNNNNSSSTVNGNSNKTSATTNSNNNSNNNNTNGDAAKSPEKKFLKKTPSTRSLTKKATDSDSSSSTTNGSSSSPTKKVEPLPKITEMLPPATVLSTTTDTVTKPLKIEATIDTPLKTSASATNILTKPIKETPMYMDEDAETLLKDHNMSKLSPAATAIISLSSEPPPQQSQTRTLPSVETTTTTTTSAVTAGGVTHVTIGNNGQSVNSSTLVVNSNGGVGGPHVAKNNINKLISPDDSFGARVHYENSGTVLHQEVQPIKIMVQEKGQNMEVQSGNVRFPPNATNGTAQGAGAPPHPREEEPPAEEVPTSRCGRFMHKFKQKMCCACCKKSDKADPTQDKPQNQGCFACLKKKKLHDVEEIIISSAEEVEGAKKSFMDKLKCCSCRRSNKVGDSTTGCCGLGKKKEKWTERRDSILSAPVPLTAGDRCKNFFKFLFCCGCGCAGCRCCRKTPAAPKIDDAASRRASLLSKKKSLTPTVIPQEDPKNKLDSSLVEYTSTMKAAIPVLPIALAYFCLFFNIFAPGTGTVFSGLFCLCMGKPRFSQRDDPKSRVGSFIINVFIGAGQLFTVLFCLVGWGWSIWWGVIMIKVAKKYRKIKILEKRMEAQQEKEAAGSRSKEGSQKRDVEKGRS
ncbi:protein stum-like isoform X2 [Atheta coriaria]|uniref:protein stum-like isoform X2 n=1 Tax=Dalotia coriaria TaxID=877792 RepID=UPI0031F3AA4D